MNRSPSPVAWSIGALVTLGVIGPSPIAHADVTYLSATRTTLAGDVAGPSSFTADDFAPFSHTTSATAGFGSICFATLDSLLGAAGLAYSGQVQARGDVIHGIVYTGTGAATQDITVRLAAAHRIWIEGAAATLVNTASIATIRDGGVAGAGAPVPTAATTVFPAGTYEIVTRNSVTTSSFGAGPLSFSLTIHFDLECRADFNSSGSLDSQDIFDFLNAWFAASPRADFNGTGGVGVQDIFDFLNAWLAGC